MTATPGGSTAARRASAGKAKASIGRRDDGTQPCRIPNTTTTVPLVRIGRVYHVGTMDPERKRDGSLEGAGLSVSLHPAAWRRIARGAVGGDTWSLVREGGAFVDAHRLRKPHRDAALRWAIEVGYAVESDAWSWLRWDDEDERHLRMVFATRDEAETERGPDGDGDVRRIRGHRSTPLLERSARQISPALTSDHVLDLVLPFWSREVHGIDGVWWRDRLDPAILSAPRGVIHPSAVASWRAERADDVDA